MNPTKLVGLLAVSQLLVWTLAPTLTHSSPPLDVVESYMWGREWVIATYKHPALPSWALEATRLITGAIGWPAYLLSQACVAAMFLFIYLLGRELMGASRAAAGTLLLTGVTFYAWPTTEFNHNIAELPIWAAMSWALWHAVQRRGLGWWMLLGALAALAMYAKFSSALLLEQGEGHVGTIVSKGVGCDAAGLLGGLGFCQRCPKIAQGTQPPLAEHAPCVLDDRSEDAIDSAVRTADRAE
jgi:hypothetical protein